ncbi:DUF3040 domain-containing protein [Saccharomonospora azurea]|uniref:DUF3040 domain-containing protein n=1 Tax=Saccharomonospora azurea TaxID=40988 RepID=UPI0009DA5EE9|nr:DUF3040 domain-containing protein [Saccharomonospora azurea]
MSLNEEELNRLKQLESELRADDPRLDRSLRRMVGSGAVASRSPPPRNPSTQAWLPASVSRISTASSLRCVSGSMRSSGG